MKVDDSEDMLSPEYDFVDPEFARRVREGRIRSSRTPPGYCASASAPNSLGSGKNTPLPVKEFVSSWRATTSSIPITVLSG